MWLEDWPPTNLDSRPRHSSKARELELQKQPREPGAISPNQEPKAAVSGPVCIKGPPAVSPVLPAQKVHVTRVCAPPEGTHVPTQRSPRLQGQAF